MHEHQSPSLDPVRGSAFSAFIQLLQQVNDGHWLLVPIRHRAYDRQTALSGGDYDYLLPEQQVSSFLSLLFAVMSQAWVNFSIEQTKPEKLVIYLHEAAENANITLEIWSHLEVKDPAHQSQGLIRFEDLQPHLVQQPAGGYRLPLAIEGYYYLSHLATKRKSLALPEVQRRLEHYRLAAEAADDTQLQELLTQLQQGGSIAGAAKLANQRLQELGVLHPKSRGITRFRERLTEAWHRLQRRHLKASAHRRIIAFLGPDGVGKSTLIEQCRLLLQTRASYFRFKKMFRGSLLYALLYRWRYPTLARQHGGDLPKNEFDEIQAEPLFWIAWLNFPLLWLRARLFGYQLSDRYYPDLLFRHLRRDQETASLSADWRTLAHHIPKPAWQLQLDADTSVILARKQELPAASIDFYRTEVFTIYQASPAPFYTYMNTGHPLDHSRATLRLAAREFGLDPHPGSEMVELDETLKLGEGNERICYQHPTQPGLVIKVTKSLMQTRDQNQIEALYLDELARREVPFDHIPRLYGWVNTPQGNGLMFEQIANNDGTPLETLQACLEQGLLSPTEAKRLLEGLYEYLHRHAIIFADVGINNLVCQRRPHGWHLVIIDGLGARRLGWKFNLYRKLPSLSRAKLRRQWAILLGKLKL